MEYFLFESSFPFVVIFPQSPVTRLCMTRLPCSSELLRDLRFVHQNIITAALLRSDPAPLSMWLSYKWGWEPQMQIQTSLRPNPTLILYYREFVTKMLNNRRSSKKHSLRESSPENCIIITQYQLQVGRALRIVYVGWRPPSSSVVSVIPTKDLISSALQLPTNTLTV